MLDMYWTLACSALFLIGAECLAQPDDGLDPLFASNAVLEARIEAPLTLLARERPDEEEHPGRFYYKADNGAEVPLDIEVRTRGRLRRSKEICSFPPLRLDFEKAQVADTLFDKQNKLKLVTHCKSGVRYQQSVIAEYLVYRIFNLLSPASFHARLLYVSYEATDGGRDIESYAIIIEHKDRLEKRFDAKTVRTEQVDMNDIRPDDLNLTSVFQFLIGNTDFSPVASAPDEDCCHNQVLLVPETGLDYTVPYDFDQSGFVNAPYAAPNPRFKLRSTRQRLYRGRCDNNEYLPASLERFRARRGDIESLVSNQVGLEKGARRMMLEYIETFYDTIDDPKRLQRELIDSCL
jgi:hypothetical protein